MRGRKPAGQEPRPRATALRSAPLNFWSADGQYGLTVGTDCVAALLRTCTVAGAEETGGVLVGAYQNVRGAALDCAVVSQASGPPEDSRAGLTWFERGVRGLQRMLDDRWQRGTGYYLGEWHFHPFAAPRPSTRDLASLAGISANSSYRCPEPIVLIVGGNPSSTWSAAAFVYLRGSGLVELSRSMGSPTGEVRSPP